MPLAQMRKEMDLTMDDSQKRRIDQWVEDTLYHNLEQLRGKGSVDTAMLASLTPLIQLYQAQRLQSIEEELRDLWRLFADGQASVVMNTSWEGLDVNIKEVPQEKPPQVKRKPMPLPTSPLSDRRKGQDE